jgi:hypothetical protein
VILFVCYASALFAACTLTRRIASASTFHGWALAILLFSANLIVPITYAGLVGQINPAGIVTAGILLWSGQVLLARHLQPLPASAFELFQPMSQSMRIAFIGGVSLISATVLLTTGYVLLQQDTIANADSLFQYIPNLINMVQAGTLFDYNGLVPYFPMGYETIFAWEIVLTQSYQHVNALHIAIYLGGIFYGVCLLQILLKERPRHIRLLALLIGTLLFVSLSHHLRILSETGKNDVLMWACGLASLYYCLRFWIDGQNERFLVLLGIPFGIYFASKLTAFTWIAPLILVHMGWMVWQGQLRKILRHGLLIGVPVIVIAAPWGMRALAGLHNGHAPNLTRLSTEMTVVNQLFAPEFTFLIGNWMTWFGIAAVGVVLMLAVPARLTWLSLLGALMLLVSLTGIGTNSDFTRHHAGIALTYLVSIPVVWTAWRRRGSLSTGLVLLFLSTLLLTTVFLFSPFSAWIYWDEEYTSVYAAILYRLLPGTYSAFCIASLVLIAERLVPRTKPLTTPYSLPHLAKSSLGIYGLMPIVLTLLLVQTFKPTPLPGWLREVPPPLPNTAPLQEWIESNVRNARIYSINESPMQLFGADLSNRVFYRTGEHEGYLGDQAYRWQDIQSLIADYDLDYIVVKFGYHLVMQADLRPTPNVLAEIDQMRSNLTTIYDNGTVVIFAVQANASDCPCPRVSDARR